MTKLGMTHMQTSVKMAAAKYNLQIWTQTTVKRRQSLPVFSYSPFQGGTSVVVPYCYLFLMTVLILWFSYYVSDIFCGF